MAAITFDATQVAPDTGVQDAIPAGWYNAAMDQSEMKPTKDTSGAYLECRFNILDGQYAGRKVYARLNLRNANAQAVEIAYKQLSAICHATGVLQMSDSQQLHGRPLKIRVKLKPATDQYEAGNEITSYKNINEQVQMAGAPGAPGAPVAAPPQPAFAPPPAAAPVATGAPAWGAPPPAAPAQAAPPAGNWAPPAGAPQPWEQPGAPATAPAPAYGQPAAPAQVSAPAQAAPGQPGGTVPPWAANQNPQGATPPWMQQPQQ